MLKQNKNRGAGLITVVVVLAVASILLAWTILLSFTQYRNAIQSEIDSQHLAEVELCAELIVEALKQGGDIENLLATGSIISDFYGDMCEKQADGTYLLGNATVEIKKDKETSYILTISCEEVTKAYLASKNDSTWVISDYQEVTE